MILFRISQNPECLSAGNAILALHSDSPLQTSIFVVVCEEKSIYGIYLGVNTIWCEKDEISKKLLN